MPGILDHSNICMFKITTAMIVTRIQDVLHETIYLSKITTTKIVLPIEMVADVNDTGLNILIIRYRQYSA